MDLIIGAGISGLAYAGYIPSSDYLIIERDANPGGYCKTIKKDGFVWDYSGHFFHFRHPEIKKYLTTHMADEDILDVQKRSQIFHHGLYVDFPFQKNIHQLEKEEFIDCLYDLFHREESQNQSFKTMVYARFGRSIAEKFLIPYNEKLYACDLDLLDADAMGRFFPNADPMDIIKNFKRPDNNSYNSTFTYPRSGAFAYVEALLYHVDQAKICANESLIRVDIESKIAYTTQRKIHYDRLISSIPLPKLLDATGMAYHQEIYSWNKVLVFNLGFDKKGNDTINHWVYFSSKEFVFYRVGYYDNIFNDDRLSMYIEIGLEPLQSVDINASLEVVLRDLRKGGLITDHHLVAWHAVVMDPAYVHVNSRSEKDKKEQIQRLGQYDIYSIGRYGGWKYCSIEDNLVEAQELAKKLQI